MSDNLQAIRELKAELSGALVKLELLESSLQVPALKTEPSRRAVRPYYGFSPDDGFQILKDKWCQKSFIGIQSKALREGLQDAITATRNATPHRTSEQSFRLVSPTGRTLGSQIRVKERRLEDKVWEKWRPRAGIQPCEAWRFIAARQVPLFDAQEKRGWGHIDLLALDNDGLVVVELKDGPSKEPPTRPLMEAAAYAIALQENWGAFAAEFEALLEEQEVPLPKELTAESIRLMILAPTAYWDRWRFAQTITSDDWNEYSQLLDAMNASNFSTRFAELFNIENGDDLNVKVIDFPFDGRNRRQEQ